MSDDELKRYSLLYKRQRGDGKAGRRPVARNANSINRKVRDSAETFLFSTRSRTLQGENLRSRNVIFCWCRESERFFVVIFEDAYNDFSTGAGLGIIKQMKLIQCDNNSTA